MPFLARLPMEDPGKVENNPAQLQRYDADVATCGRWCALWVMQRNMPVDDFVKVLEDYKKQIDLDELVTLLTDDELENNISGY